MAASCRAAGARETRPVRRTRHAQQTEDARRRATCRVDKGRPLKVKSSSSVSAEQRCALESARVPALTALGGEVRYGPVRTSAGWSPRRGALNLFRLSS